MIKEYSAGSVIYQKNGNTYTYLIVQSVVNNNWGFPKGHIEGNETPKETAKREIFEEVNLKPKFDFNFIQTTEYMLAPQRKKEVTFYIAEYIPGQEVKVQEEEISNYRWVTLEQAKKYLTEHDKMRVLTKAEEYLSRK